MVTLPSAASHALPGLICRGPRLAAWVACVGPGHQAGMGICKHKPRRTSPYDRLAAPACVLVATIWCHMGQRQPGVRKESILSGGLLLCSLDTSFLDALALDVTDGSLDFMIGEPFPGKMDVAAEPRSPVTDDQPADGAHVSAIPTSTLHACTSRSAGLGAQPEPPACPAVDATALPATCCLKLQTPHPCDRRRSSPDATCSSRHAVERRCGTMPTPLLHVWQARPGRTTPNS